MTGLKKGENPNRCRIGKGIYFFNMLGRALNYQKKCESEGTRVVILTCALHTRGVMTDLGNEDLFQAEWVAGAPGIALGRHFAAMGTTEEFTELVKKKASTITVLKVGREKAKLPDGSVFKKTHDRIWRNQGRDLNIQHETLL